MAGISLHAPPRGSPPHRSSVRSRGHLRSRSAAASTARADSKRVAASGMRGSASTPRFAVRSPTSRSRSFPARSALLQPPPCRSRASVACRTNELAKPYGQQSTNRSCARSTRPAEVPPRVRHRHRIRYCAARAGRGRHPSDLAQEERAELHARVASQVVPTLAHDARAELGPLAHRAHRLPSDLLLLGAEVKDERTEEPR